jgi:hypothetical protein
VQTLSNGEPNARAAVAEEGAAIPQAETLRFIAFVRLQRTTRSDPDRDPQGKRPVSVPDPAFTHADSSIHDCSQQ